MNFGDAIAALKRGSKVYRAGWNGKGQHLELQVPDAHSKMSLPYIFIMTVHGDRVPWLASQTDVLAEDWTEVLEVRSVSTTLAAGILAELRALREVERAASELITDDSTGRFSVATARALAHALANVPQCICGDGHFESGPVRDCPRHGDVK